MKLTTFKNIFKTLLFTLLCSSSSSVFAMETFIFDPDHTFVTFHISHFGFSHPSGKWPATGTIVIDEKNPENSRVDARIQVASLTTGVPKLDERLKSKDFFDALTYPVATFVSNKIVMTGKYTATVRGILTLHGVSQQITLDVTLNNIGGSPITHKKTIGFSAVTDLLRTDFNISAYMPQLSNRVNLDIEAEAALS